MILKQCKVHEGFPCGSAGKESTCNAGNLDSIPGLGRSPREGKGYPLQYSGLENSMDCMVHGVAKSWTWLSNFYFHFHFILVVKNLPANAEDVRDSSLIPGLGGSSGGGHSNPFQCSCLENPMNRGALWATVHGVSEIRTQLSDQTHTHKNQEVGLTIYQIYQRFDLEFPNL